MTFTKFPDEFWNLLDSTAEVAVMLRILKNIGFAENGVCFESRDAMCRACHITKNTWKAAIESLKEKELIIVEESHNRPHKITLHEKVAGVKIRTRNRYNIFRGSNLTSAKNGGDRDSHTEGYTDREPFQVVKRRVEAFQDARNAVPSTRTRKQESEGKAGTGHGSDEPDDF